MKHLLFKLKNQDIQYVIVSTEKLYFLNTEEYGLLKNAADPEVIKDFNYLALERISKLTSSKRKTVVSVYDLNGKKNFELDFESISLRKKFIRAFPGFNRVADRSKTRIRPIAALVLMLFTYSFIWAGTRPSPEDIAPEGIRWRLAYLNVKFLEWLNSLIGQSGIMILGICLLVLLIYLVFKPELWLLFSHKLEYSNRGIRQSSPLS